MTRLPMASEIKLKRLMDDSVSLILADLQERFYEEATTVEVDTLELEVDTKMALVTYLEDLGYFVDESYGEDVMHVSLED